MPAGCHSGSQRRHKQERRADVAREHVVERRRVELCCRGPARHPGVVDQDVNLADVACQALHVGCIAEVGSDEAGPAFGGGDLLDRLRAAGGVAAVNQDLGPVPRQL